MSFDYNVFLAEEIVYWLKKLATQIWGLEFGFSAPCKSLIWLHINTTLVYRDGTGRSSGLLVNFYSRDGLSISEPSVEEANLDI